MADAPGQCTSTPGTLPHDVLPILRSDQAWWIASPVVRQCGRWCRHHERSRPRTYHGSLARRHAARGGAHRQTGMNGPSPFIPVLVVAAGYLLPPTCTSGTDRISGSRLDLISAAVLAPSPERPPASDAPHPPPSDGPRQRSATALKCQGMASWTGRGRQRLRRNARICHQNGMRVCGRRQAADRGMQPEGTRAPQGFSWCS
jgi:hypothetical protein